MKKIISLFLISLVNDVYATVYYVAANGNDSNNGTSAATPFKTIARLNTLLLQPGDKILFRRSDVFRGQLEIKQSGNATAPIILDAYGNGALPVISGTETVRNWVVQSGNIYKAAFSSNPVMVFKNGQLHLPARFPNSGFLGIDEAQGNNKFYDAALTQPNAYWNDATLHNRMVRWDYGEHKVQSFSNGTITIAAPAEYDFINGWGYFFSNKFELLDTAGEFFYNLSQQQLYIWSSSVPNNVEASVYDYAVLLAGISYIAVNNLSFTGQQISGVNSGTDNTNITVRKCGFSNIFSKAIEMYNVNNVVVSNNLITGILNKGIVLYDCRNVQAERNTIRRIGMLPGIASKDEIAYTAMEVEGNIEKGSILFNTLDSIGYNGLRFSKNTRIEKNNIKNFCLTTDDGSAIYTWSNNDTINRNGTGCTISNNIIQNGLGNIQATTDLFGFGNGIYMDDASGNAIIKSNTIVNCKAIGIFLHNSINNQVDSNTIFNCGQTQMLLSQDGLSLTQMANNKINRNILYSINANTYPLQVTNYENINLAFATWQGNYYCNPYNAFGIYTETRVGNSSNSKLYTVNEWKAANDNNAKESYVQWSENKVTDTVGGNLLVNGDFNSNTDGWYCWSPDNACTFTWGTNNNLNSGSMHLQSNNGLAYNLNYIELYAGQTYQLSFSNIAPAPGAFAVQTMDASTYAGLELYKFVPAGSTRTENKIIFKPTFTTNPARINFYVNSSAHDYWLDNIKLYKVNTTYDDPLLRNLVYINETNAPKTFILPQTLYNLDNNPVSGSITLAPFTSRVLLKKDASTITLIKNEISSSPAVIKIFPNPAKDKIIITSNQPLKSIFITNLAGKVVLQCNAANSLQAMVPTGKLTAGMYFISLFDKNNKQVAKEKLVK